MKERPILFSGAMVRALLDGSKTQTRRLIKPDPGPYWNPIVGLYNPIVIENGGYEAPGPEIFGASDEVQGRKCPYGQPGDRLWVRETFQPLFAEGWQHGVGDRVPDFETGEGYKIGYPATDGAVEWIDGDDNITSRSKPSIHMPRWASRILLEIVSVRVERLNDCSVEDALAEGITHRTMNDPRAEYAQLWESINGAGSWAVNPWVWCVEFKRVLP